MIDLVLTYVDNTDIEWQRSYLTYSRINHLRYDPSNVRFRNWGMFKCVLRSIDNNMKFINNLYIIVSSDSQVPKYVNKDTVKIIKHSDIIPKQYLPTFNSNCIELFIYKIKDLSERFIYSNDDIFFMNRNVPEDYFMDNIPRAQCHETVIKRRNLYCQTLLNTMNLAMQHNSTFKLGKNMQIIRSNHSANPMLKSTWEMYWEQYSDILYNSISKLRETKNITQELSNFHHYMYNKCNAINVYGCRNTRYFNFINRTSEDLRHCLYDKNILSLCINDAGAIDFDVYKNVVIKLLNERFPKKSKFEM